jgi:hypothetical protein
MKNPSQNKNTIKRRRKENFHQKSLESRVKDQIRKSKKKQLQRKGTRKTSIYRKIHVHLNTKRRH